MLGRHAPRRHPEGQASGARQCHECSTVVAGSYHESCPCCPLLPLTRGLLLIPLDITRPSVSWCCGLRTHWVTCEQSVAIGLDEALPLWAISTTEVGGLGWSMSKIGQVRRLGLARLPARPFLAPSRLAIPRMSKPVTVRSSRRAVSRRKDRRASGLSPLRSSPILAELPAPC